MPLRVSRKRYVKILHGNQKRQQVQLLPFFIIFYLFLLFLSKYLSIDKTIKATNKGKNKFSKRYVKISMFFTSFAGDKIIIPYQKMKWCITRLVRQQNLSYFLDKLLRYWLVEIVSLHKYLKIIQTIIDFDYRVFYMSITNIKFILQSY